MRAIGAALLGIFLAGCGTSAKAPAGDGQVRAGAIVFRRCTACHTVGRDGSDTDGPNLYGVVGAPVAERRPRFGYTASLKRFGGLWTRDRLNQWLTDPRRLVPGTTMAFAGLPDPEDRKTVIAFLAAQSAPD